MAAGRVTQQTHLFSVRRRQTADRRLAPPFVQLIERVGFGLKQLDHVARDGLLP
jgi:hypothetical protein